MSEELDKEELEEQEENEEESGEETVDPAAKAEADAASYVVSEEIIETTWECARCHATNPGRSMRCDSCGSPKTADAAYTVNEDGPVVTDAEQLADAAAGLHWECPYCGGQNRGNVPQCSSCGATVAPEKRKPAKADVASGEQVAAETTATPAKKGKLLYIIGGVVAVGLVVTGLSQCGSEDSVAVKAMNWQREIIIEQKVTNTREDWKKEIKKEAYDLRCVEKAHGKKKVKVERRDADGQVITEQKCSDRTEDMKNGYAKKIRECKDVPLFDEKEVDIMDSYCSYKIDKWQELKKFQAQAAGTENIHWPAVEAVSSLAPTREVRNEQYNVVVTKADGTELTYKAKDATEYAGYVVGKSYTAVISGFGKHVDSLGENK